MQYFLSVIALVFIIEGMPYFLSPSGIKKWMSMLQEMTDGVVRAIGGLFMFLGVVILYIALRVI